MPDVVRASVSRRALLLGGGGLALAGCGSDSHPSTAPSSPTPTPTVDPTVQLVRLEQKLDGMLGFFAIDAVTGRTLGTRSTERFLLCSTHKVLTVATVLHRDVANRDLLNRRLHYAQSDVLAYAPVTSKHVDDGMTVAALCEAALTVSDNTAANLLLGLLGGPSAVTAWLRSIGDKVTRLDRTEPTLNDVSGDLDTTTPQQLATTLRALLVGDALDPDGRARLTGWMRASTTGLKLVRAGVPSTWVTADKSGTGSAGEVNDVAYTGPKGAPRLIVTAFTAPRVATSTAGPATVAAATRIATAALGLT